MQALRCCEGGALGSITPAIRAMPSPDLQVSAIDSHTDGTWSPWANHRLGLFIGGRNTMSICMYYVLFLPHVSHAENWIRAQMFSYMGVYVQNEVKSS